MLKQCFQIQASRNISSSCYASGNASPFPQGHAHEDLLLDSHFSTGTCLSRCTDWGMKIKAATKSLFDKGRLVFKCKISKDISSSINNKKKQERSSKYAKSGCFEDCTRQRDLWKGKDPRHGEKTEALIYRSIRTCQNLPTPPSGFQTATFPVLAKHYT